MEQQRNGTMQHLKKVFLVLWILDLLALLLAVINTIPTFGQLAEYGQIMLIVTSILTALSVAVLVFEIVTKIFLMKSTSPAFSWASGRKGYFAAAKLLLLFNFGTAIINVLAMGGAGATLWNQGNLCLRVLASVVEMIAVLCYLRTAKRILKNKN